MLDGASIQVWLEAESRPQAQLIVPYVRSPAAGEARYRIVLSREAAGGRSLISQGGTVSLLPSEARALSRVSVNRQPHDRCRVEIELYEGERRLARHVLECPTY